MDPNHSTVRLCEVVQPDLLGKVELNQTYAFSASPAKSLPPSSKSRDCQALLSHKNSDLESHHGHRCQSGDSRRQRYPVQSHSPLSNSWTGKRIINTCFLSHSQKTGLWSHLYLSQPDQGTKGVVESGQVHLVSR
jgi:hypothetical protein